MLKSIEGIGASGGYGIEKIFRYEQAEIEIDLRKIDDIDGELKKFKDSLDKSVLELTAIKDKTAMEIDEKSAEVFEAHIQILNDPEYIGAVNKRISEEGINAEYALQEVTDMFLAIFKNLDDPYIKERAADIKDVSMRVARHILGIESIDPSRIEEAVIIVAKDLTPSDIAMLNKKFVKGFITNVGGRTSHSAIMARTLEIPAVVGAKTAFEEITPSDRVILDGFTGDIIMNPDEETINRYKKKLEDYNEKKKIWAKLKDEKSFTLDDFQVDLSANIGTPDDVEGVIDNGAEGIGLYRTEFLYMGKTSLPTEDEQFNAYKFVLEKMAGKPVVIRTLDVGGDKELDYLDMNNEMNPFLGNRAIRLCMGNKPLFRTQLRALLRASVYGNMHIMFPMIATVNEFLCAKAFLENVKKELIEENIPVSDDLKVGMMVEVPAAVMIADQLAKEVDFFSIGTNDLIQYTFAADRMNETVSYLYQPYNPSLLRMVKQVIDAARKEKKWVGICGEMASEIKALPVLLGLGLDEFSMSATSILEARYMLSKINKRDAYCLAIKALNMRTQDEVLHSIEEFLSESNIL